MKQNYERQRDKEFASHDMRQQPKTKGPGKPTPRRQKLEGGASLVGFRSDDS